MRDMMDLSVGVNWRLESDMLLTYLYIVAVQTGTYGG